MHQRNLPLISSVLLLAGCGSRTGLDGLSTSGSPTTGTSNAGPAATSVAVGSGHTCVALSGGTVWCWGYNVDGELGNGNNTNSDVPVSVSSVTNVMAVTVGGVYESVNLSPDFPVAHSCAVLSGGTIQCWGCNDQGQLGNNTTTNSSAPVTVVDITNAVAVTAGGLHSCAMLSGGTIQCWGCNDQGQLGNNTTTDSSAPVTVFGITNAVAVAAGAVATCAVLSGGTIQCWGLALVLGNDATTSSTTPVTVSSITNAISVSIGEAHACAVLSDGSVMCWGSGHPNFGQLGNGTNTNGSVPVTVSGITGAVAVAAGYSYACAVLSGGTIRCWGYNADGELGNGTTTNSPVPVTVNGITSGVSVAAASAYSFGHTCAILNGGTVQCWGDNSYGELGNGNTTNSLLPVTVTGF